MKKAYVEASEDRASRLEGELKAHKYAKKFCASHAEELSQLIATYSDDDARYLLECLRERFWGTDWKP